MPRFDICGHELVLPNCLTSVPLFQAKRVWPRSRRWGSRTALLTRYTSFVAVHELVRRTTEGAEDVNQPLPLPAGVSDLAVGVTNGAEPDIVWVSVMVVALLTCVSFLRMRRRGAAA